MNRHYLCSFFSSLHRCIVIIEPIGLPESGLKGGSITLVLFIHAGVLLKVLKHFGGKPIGLEIFFREIAVLTNQMNQDGFVIESARYSLLRYVIFHEGVNILVQQFVA